MFGRKKKRGSTVEARVQRGMALLDQEKPGWEQKVGIYALNIARGDRCVLGQLYGGYGYGAIHLRLSHQDCRNLGFQASVPSMLSGIDREYEALTAEWREQITQRRKVKV